MSWNQTRATNTRAARTMRARVLKKTTRRTEVVTGRRPKPAMPRRRVHRAARDALRDRLDRLDRLDRAAIFTPSGEQLPEDADGYLDLWETLGRLLDGEPA